MEEMTRAEFKRKYSIDNHLGLHCKTEFSKLGQGSLIRREPGDRGVSPRESNPLNGKKEIEKAALEKRSDDFKHYLLDAVSVRKKEILDKKEVPMVQLLQIVSRNLPQEVKSDSNVTFTFADMVKRATLELNKVETIDIEKEENADVLG